MHTHRVTITNEHRSGFFYTKTDICILCLDGYSVSVQEIVNKAENTIKPQNQTLPVIEKGKYVTRQFSFVNT